MKFDLSSIRRSTAAPSAGPSRAATAGRDTVGLLALIAAVSAVIYALAFVRPYSLLEWANWPQMSIAKITHGSLSAAFVYFLAFGFLFLYYWIAVRNAAGTRSRAAWAIVIGGAVAFTAILLFLYPVDALDVFDYIVRGRMQVFHGGNPFYQPPSAFKSDPFFPYTGWVDARTAYGPAWELLAATIVRFTGESVVVNVLAFKLLSIVSYGVTVWLIARMLLRHAPERALYGTVLFAWNPLVLYVVAGNGHNDALMVLLVVLGFYWMAEGHFTLATLAQVVGALVKFIPALLVPLMLLAGWKRMKSWPARISFLLVTGGASLVLGMVTSLPYWRGGDFFGLEWRGTMFTTSLPTWAVIVMERVGINTSFSDLLASRAALLLLAAWMARQLFHLWRSDRAGTEKWDPAAYIRAGLSILLFYLLVSALWFQPWYTIWGVALAALLPDQALTRGAIFLSFMSNWKMIAFDYYIVHSGPLPPFQVREWPLTAATLGPTWAYFLYAWRRLQQLPGRLVSLRAGTPTLTARAGANKNGAPTPGAPSE